MKFPIYFGSCGSNLVLTFASALTRLPLLVQHGHPGLRPWHPATVLLDTKTGC